METGEEQVEVAVVAFVPAARVHPKHFILPKITTVLRLIIEIIIIPLEAITKSGHVTSRYSNLGGGDGAASLLSWMSPVAKW
jgi:hypothetical protein